MIDWSLLQFVRILVNLLRYLPERVANLIAYGVVRFGFGFVPRYRKVALRNLSLIFPNIDSARKKQIFNQSLRVLSRNLVTFARIPDLTKEQLEGRINYKELDMLVKSVRSKSGEVGILLPTMHFGNFEFLLQAFGIMIHPIAALVRPFQFPKLDFWWNKRRELHGNEIFGRNGAFKEIEKRLARGQDVTLLADQNVKPNHAMFVNFFDIPCATTKTIGLAAIRTGCPIICICGAEIESNRYQIYCQEIKNPIDEDIEREEKIRKVMIEVHQFYERVISAHPENWFWIHRRFKTRPPGEKESMYD